MSDDNPYLPPKAAVADVAPEAPLTRPMAVTLALWLIGARVLMAGVGLVNSLIRLGDPGTGSGYWVAAGFFLTSVVVVSTVAWFIARGKNWARVVYLILTIFALLGLALTVTNLFTQPAAASLRASMSLGALATLIVPTLLSVTVVVLLFGPGRAWFAPRE